MKEILVLTVLFIMSVSQVNAFGFSPPHRLQSAIQDYDRNQSRRKGVTLRDLDHVLEKAESLEDFLSRPALIDEYFDKASIYYRSGGHGSFDRRDFDVFLSELRFAIIQIPELKDRFWDRDSTHAFSFQTDAQNVYFADEGKLKEAYFTILGQLREASGSMDSVKAKEILQRRASGERSDSIDHFNSAVAKVLRDYLWNLPSNQWDAPEKMLTLLDQMREKKFRIPGLPNHPVIRDQIKRILPTRHQIETKFLPKETDATTNWEFQTVHPFHGVFRGIEVGECWFGQKVSRWGLVAIRNNQLYYVHRNGKYRGFVHLIPVRNQIKDGPIYGSVDVQAYDFPKKLQVVSSSSLPRSHFIT